MEEISFNKPYLSGNELVYIKQVVEQAKVSGNGFFTKKSHAFFQERYHFKKCLLTTSCTDALEMAAILIGIEPGDEIIVPSFTFVSTANAFILRGGKIVFADSSPEHPNIDADKIESLITSRTKAIVPVHYGGVACDMDKIMALAAKYKLFVVEDAAQAIDSYYKGKPLGGIGHLGAFSFHETKNVISGEGGMLAINDKRFEQRAEIIWEKGTNRSAFWRGEVDKYGWVDIGSSFLPSEIVSAFLYAQLEKIDELQSKRIEHWNSYYSKLKPLHDQGFIKLPFAYEWATNNAHLFYILCADLDERQQLIAHLKAENIQAVFHYLSLHASPYFSGKHDGRKLVNSDRYMDCLLRLPLFYELSEENINRVVNSIERFYDK